MEVSGQIQARPLYLQGKSRRYPLDRRLWAPQPVWTAWRREKSLAVSGIEHLSSIPQFLAIATELWSINLRNMHILFEQKFMNRSTRFN
jgi:hypothetical protein